MAKRDRGEREYCDGENKRIGLQATAGCEGTRRRKREGGRQDQKRIESEAARPGRTTSRRDVFTRDLLNEIETVASSKHGPNKN